MAQRKPKLGDIVEIHWDDATADDQAHSLASLQAEKPYLCKRKAIGYYILMDEGFHVMCGDITLQHTLETDPIKDKNYSSLQNVPRGMVTDLRVVAPRQPDKRKRKGRT